MARTVDEIKQLIADGTWAQTGVKRTIRGTSATPPVNGDIFPGEDRAFEVVDAQISVVKRASGDVISWEANALEYRPK